jgi:uncharacterized protein
VARGREPGRERVTPYEPRCYRAAATGGDLATFQVTLRETDLQIRAERDLSEQAARLLEVVRGDIESFLDRWPIARDSFVPLAVPDSAPSVVRRMAEAAAIAGVGPMAAVAGALAEDVGRSLMAFSRTVIVENGGDIFMTSPEEIDVGLFAGDSELTGKIAFRVGPADMPIGICTSARTVGHSTSLGRADAAVVFSGDAAVADAVATALGNRVKTAADIEAALDWALSRPRVRGAAVVVGDRLGIRGQVQVVGTARS